MPSSRVLLRMVLILVLCADGIFAAWASTRMAVAELGHGAYSGAAHHSADAKTRGAVREIADEGGSERRGATGSGVAGHGSDPSIHHDDCDCGGLSGCACSCMLTFFPGRNAPLFAAQHTLAAAYLAPPLLPPVPHRISPLFRPPIA